MDFLLSTTVIRHLRKIKHECDQLLKNGVFQDELDEYSISVPMFGRGENISEDEIKNVELLYSYLSTEKIAARSLPTRPNIDDGTLDHVGDAKKGFEYITVQYVTVFDYDALEDLIDKEIFSLSTFDFATIPHLQGRALIFDNFKFKYHGSSVRLKYDSLAFKYLHAILTLAKDEKTVIDCADIAGLCDQKIDGFTKTLKDSLSKTIVPRLNRFDKQKKGVNFEINTKQPDRITVVNPKLN